MDLSTIPILDNHCHFFSLAMQQRPLHRMLTLSLNSPSDDQLRHSLLYRMVISALAEVLDTPLDENQVLAARQEYAERDYKGYVNKLFDDVNLAGLMVDIGLQKSLVDNSDFENLANRTVWYVYRGETVVDRLWRDRVEPAVGLELFRQEVKTAIGALPAIALKSIIGYRTGLQVETTVTEKQVAQTMKEREYRSLFFLETARLCLELDLPFHIHTGFGESNNDLRENNPIHLKPFLDSPYAADIDVVLIHGGYPYAFEAGYLAAMYPNVHVDISELIPFVTLRARAGIEEIMNMCPLNKLMYGSDGFDVPESHWLSARMGKQILRDILGDLVDKHIIDTSYAKEVARMVLHGNSLRLHGKEQWS